MEVRIVSTTWLRARARIALVAFAFAAMTATAQTVDTSASYVLVNRNSGKVVDVFNLATNDGARIAQWTRNDGAWQQWQFVDSGGGYYRLRSRHSGKVLDVYQWSTAENAQIVQWADLNGANQQFRLVSSDGGYVRLINRHSNKALEVQGASTANGTSVVQYSDWNGAVPAMAARARRRNDTAARRHVAIVDSLELQRCSGGTEAGLRTSRHRSDQGLHGRTA